MLRPFPPDLMEAYPVSKRVNSHVNDDEGLIERVEIVPEPEAVPGLPEEFDRHAALE